jgi:chaperone modulatory protein CbpM
MEAEKYISIQTICQYYPVEAGFVYTLEEYGLISITEEGIAEEELPRLEKILRLNRDLSVNPEGIDIILDLVDKMEQMKAENQMLKNKISRFFTEP